MARFGVSVSMAAIAALLGVGLAGVAPAKAQTPKDFKIGIVMSLTGGFVAAAKDTMDGVEGWEKARGGLPGRKIAYEKLDDETNPVSAANAYRRLAGDPNISLIYLFIN